MLTVATLSGCLITQPVHFDPPANSPPAIYDSTTSSFPTSRIVRLTVLPATPDGGTPMPTMPFVLDVVVFDPDVDQDLNWRAYIDANPAPFNLGRLSPLSSGARDHRSLTVTVPDAPLRSAANRCHRVQLFVSSQFADGLAPTPLLAGDVASSTWWVQPDRSMFVDMSLCPP